MDLWAVYSPKDDLPTKQDKHDIFDLVSTLDFQVQQKTNHLHQNHTVPYLEGSLDEHAQEEVLLRALAL